MLKDNKHVHKQLCSIPQDKNYNITYVVHFDIM